MEISWCRIVTNAQACWAPSEVSLVVDHPHSTSYDDTGDMVIEVNFGQVFMWSIQHKHTSPVVWVLEETDGSRAIRRDGPGWRDLIATPTPPWSWCIVTTIENVDATQEINRLVEQPFASSLNLDGFYSIVEEIIAEISILLQDLEKTSLVIWLIIDKRRAVTIPK